MKKIFIHLISIVFLVVFSGCNQIREYDGVPIEKLTFETVNYYGGFTTTYIFDFQNNHVQKSEYLPLPGETEERMFDIIATFTEDQEKAFMDHCFTYGLFNLKEHYETDDFIVDGWGWTLTLEYVDGSSKTSTGDNARPTKVFNNCATAFYDICKDGVVGYVPKNYYNPPGISISFGYKYKDNYFSGNTLSDLARVNYKWNKFESLENDLYLKSSGLNEKPKFLENYKYDLVLYTANYGDYEKFIKCILKNYDLNENLTNEKTVLSEKWFKQVEVELELNKIYVIELTFKDGDFVQYTFNTRAADSKILYGEYRYDIYNEGHSAIRINDDGTFVLSPFDYFDNKKEGNIGELIGTFGFETIDSQEYLCLYANDEEKIVFEYCARALFLDFEKTTCDVSKYHFRRRS